MTVYYTRYNPSITCSLNKRLLGTGAGDTWIREALSGGTDSEHDSQERPWMDGHMTEWAEVSVMEKQIGGSTLPLGTRGPASMDSCYLSPGSQFPTETPPAARM